MMYLMRNVFPGATKGGSMMYLMRNVFPGATKGGSMMYLKCPVCGFSFGVVFPDDITEKEKAELMECPCGAMCEETEELHPNVWEPPKEEAP